MGQGHSSPQSGAGEATEKSFEKKDYYELLEVEQNASPEEIKKAYRKKALELHPDRNYGNVEAATSLFADIQSAYEVLSDPQERSWYDSHRDAFLGGDGGGGGGGETTDYSYNTRMTTSADILKLFSKFSPQMEFTDSPSGFYGGLCETFAQLALEEEMACRWENVDIIEYPSFGSRDADLQDMRHFYAVWNSFSTKKSFSWKDVYRYSEAPDRRVRRLMEKENKRLREGAIREFNEAVRSLVAFARKRDPRYKSYKASSQHHEALRQSAAAQATKSRAANQANLRNHVIQDWSRSEVPNGDGTESSEGETEHIECIVCRKTFKSPNQFQAHERSKKHMKAVKQLRWEMRLQHKELDLDEDLVDGTIGDGSSKNDLVTAQSIHHEQTLDLSDDEMRHDTSKLSFNPDVESNSNRRADSTQVQESETPIRCRDEPDYAPREVLENRLGQGDFSTQGGENDDSVDGLSHGLSASRLNESRSSSPIKLGKAKLKRAKKAQLAAERSQSTECTVCNASFSSRNRLFSHIKLNHQKR
ncbi:hypothetical protein BDW59DRAFT_180153 [Aspergillus cavernicola]|uniref:DnaJ-domain-containing protein n=1 Tax=Aspergillus cavernicola TaxID=176166 RepID=A0ABR4IAF1_9EURO